MPITSITTSSTLEEISARIASDVCGQVALKLTTLDQWKDQLLNLQPLLAKQIFAFISDGNKKSHYAISAAETAATITAQVAVALTTHDQWREQLLDFQRDMSNKIYEFLLNPKV